MSGPAAPPEDGAEPSMEEILASIRRILDEEPPRAEPGELLLDDTMLTALPPEPDRPAPVTAVPAAPPPLPTANPALLDPATADAAAASVGNLLRAVTTDRATQLHSGGPTLEDIVRDALRPLLKQWLDQNLPPLIERLVRAEIERVISRAS
jgi:cell pole-organizing protein PopZ